MSETVNRMIIDHSDSLHVGVTDGRSYELESPLLQFTAHQVRDFRGGRNLGHGRPLIPDRFAIYELPHLI